MQYVLLPSTVRLLTGEHGPKAVPRPDHPA